MDPKGTGQGAPWITLEEVWLAYRKAKLEAFHDSNCAHGLKFAAFEDALIRNLESIHAAVLEPAQTWAENPRTLGRVAVVPKSLEAVTENDALFHYCESNMWEDWVRIHDKRKRARAQVRPVIDASVRYFVISTLWVLKVGEKLDRKMRDEHVYANRPRRRFQDAAASDGQRGEHGIHGPINWESHSLFQAYTTQYGKWRDRGIRATRQELEAGGRVVGLSLDITRFFDNVDPSFLLSESYLKRVGVELTKEEVALTKALIKSMANWRKENGLDSIRGLPVGLPSSGVIANLLLAPFDELLLDALQPAFYGRYVDDIYVCFPTNRTFRNGKEVLRWLTNRVEGMSLVKDELRLLLPYSKRSKIRFGSAKQRIFRLDGKSGLDVIRPIEEHMRKQSSAHRLLPVLPETESAMAERALLVTRDAALTTAVMREADLVTIQRAGLADLLSNAEEFSFLLKPNEWEQQRRELYGLAMRHVLTPIGFFSFVSYIPRVVGLMAACDDWEDVGIVIKRLRDLQQLLGDTTDLDRVDLRRMFRAVAKRVELAALKAIGPGSTRRLKEAARSMRRIRGGFAKGFTEDLLRNYAAKLHRSDWSRRPYYESFLTLAPRKTEKVPILPRDPYARLRIENIKQCLTAMEHTRGFSEESWRALTFPTRAMPVTEITQRLGWRQIAGGGSFRRGAEWLLYDFVLAIRGVRLPPWLRPRLLFGPNREIAGIRLKGRQTRPVRVAVANFLTTNEEWKFAARGTPVSSRERLDRLSKFLNEIVRHRPRPDYVVMPELSIPRNFVKSFEQNLAANGISLIAGLEYGLVAGSPTLRKNQALVSIFLGPGQGSISFLQGKNEPAWSEQAELQRIAKATLQRVPSHEYPELPLYASDGLVFGVLICSDLTSAKFRSRFQGNVDALFVLEWNQDVASFSSLVEASALDVHAFIVQANNRQFGDSRIRGPFKQQFLRDVVQLKGGVHDYFVVGEIDPYPLRDFQSDSAPDISDNAKFKPFPIGFRISALRRVRPD